MQSCFIYTIILLIPCILGAHGVECSFFDKGVGIKAHYSDQEPLSYCETKIYSPDNRNEPYQQGLTDRNGRFIFSPDKPGKWKVEINDGMGHGMIKEILVDKDFKQEFKESKHFTLFQKIILGLGIIGIIYTSFFIILRKRRRYAHS